jgi:hypothetical protein
MYFTQRWDCFCVIRTKSMGFLIASVAIKQKKIKKINYKVVNVKHLSQVTTIILPLINILFLISLNFNSKFYIEYDGIGNLMQYINVVSILLILTVIFTYIVEEIVKTKATLPVYISVKFLNAIFKLIYLFITVGLSKVIYNLFYLVINKLDSVQLTKAINLVRVWTKEDLIAELNNLILTTKLQFTEKEKLYLIEVSNSFKTLKENFIELLNKKIIELGFSSKEVEIETTLFSKIKLAFITLKDFLISSPSTLILTSIVVIGVSAVIIINLPNVIAFLVTLKTSILEQMKLNTKTTEVIKKLDDEIKSVADSLSVTNESVTEVEGHIQNLITNTQTTAEIINENFILHQAQITDCAQSATQLQQVVSTLAVDTKSSITDSINNLSLVTFNELKKIVSTNNVIIDTLATLIDSPSLRLDKEAVDHVLIKMMIEYENTPQTEIPDSVWNKLIAEKTPQQLIDYKHNLLNLKTEIIEPTFIGEGKRLTDTVSINPESLIEKREAFANALQDKKC